MPVYNYTTLDDPLAVKFDTNANGINSAGQVVGGYRDSSGRIHGFLYSGRAYVTIDDPLASTVTEARGINDTGLIVGYYRNTVTPADHGFIYNPSTGTYSTIDKLGASSLQATGINNAGQIVGWYSDNVGSGRHGFLFSGGLFTTIDEPFGTQGTVANGINNFGQIVGYYFDNKSNSHGFLYNPSNGSFTTLDDPLASKTFAYGINDFGQIVGSFNRTGDNVTHGWLYNGGTYTTLDPPEQRNYRGDRHQQFGRDLWEDPR